MPLRCTPASLALLVALAACDTAPADTPAAAPSGPTYQPVMSAELVPPVLRGLVLGKSSEAELTAVFPGKTLKDESLGGTGKVRYSDAPGSRVTIASGGDVHGGEAWFVADAEGTLRLQYISLRSKAVGTCKWLVDNVGPRDGAKRRPGSNRKFGDADGSVNYTAGTPDGATAVSIECNPSEGDGGATEIITYAVDASGGRSMSAQENP